MKTFLSLGDACAQANADALRLANQDLSLVDRDSPILQYNNALSRLGEHHLTEALFSKLSKVKSSQRICWLSHHASRLRLVDSRLMPTNRNHKSTLSLRHACLLSRQGFRICLWPLSWFVAQRTWSGRVCGWRAYSCPTNVFGKIMPLANCASVPPRDLGTARELVVSQDEEQRHPIGSFVDHEDLQRQGL
jgi:hypothetical protein